MMQAQKNNGPARFIVTFIVLFLVFYYFNILFFGLTSPGGHYNAFLARYFNYIDGIRWLLIKSTVAVLKCFGYTVISNKYQILVAGRGLLQVVYTCLGIGVISFFSAFVIAYPKQLKTKIIFLISGIIGIQVLNVMRLVLLALFWDRRKNQIVDHHTVFNLFIYIVIMVSLYFWIKSKKTDKTHEAN
jgi:exosortase/archaeosortase family protein